ncbi:hypothetical protein [Chitinophaga sp. SYP-B3965]|nr:hypothetical protein [Chitinophaga sp. SYP-B3965]
MEQSTTLAFSLDAYKVIKKVIKYTLYAAIIYFAIEGFIAWE